MSCWLYTKCTWYIREDLRQHTYTSDFVVCVISQYMRDEHIFRKKKLTCRFCQLQSSLSILIGTFTIYDFFSVLSFDHTWT